MKNRRTWGFFAALVVLIAAFLLLNFRIAASNTQGEWNTFSTSSGEKMPDAMQRKEKITLVVTGDGPLAGALRSAIAAKLSEAGLGEVELGDAPETAYANPVLVVDAGKPGVFWTPFFGSTHLTVRAGYASNGDTTFLSDQPVVYDSKNGPAIHLSADFTVDDRSWGMLSRPGYYQLLAEWLAQNLVDEMKKIYTPKI